MIGIFGKVTLRGLGGNFELYSDLQIPHLDRIGCNLVRPEKIGWSEKLRVIVTQLGLLLN